MCALGSSEMYLMPGIRKWTKTTFGFYGKIASLLKPEYLVSPNSVSNRLKGLLLLHTFCMNLRLFVITQCSISVDEVHEGKNK